MRIWKLLISSFNILSCISLCNCGDITRSAFGNIGDSVPAAFGDFDSDELTDLFVIHNKYKVEILFGSTIEPYFQRKTNFSCTFGETDIISSVVPGDFNGDALMDVLVTVIHKGSNAHISNVHILWGQFHRLNCSQNPLFGMIDEPLAIDYNRDMIVDLFGVNVNNTRGFWIFNSNGTSEWKPMLNKSNVPLRIPHSHAFLDLNNDNSPDLYLTAEHTFEIHLWDNHIKNFVYSHSIPVPPDVKSHSQLGQTLFMDVEIADKMDHVVPVCYDNTPECTNSTIFIYSRNNWYNLHINFQDASGKRWDFAYGKDFMDTITLRGGDYNMDGYPDMLATLCHGDDYRSFLLINVECKKCTDGFNRSFEIQWDVLTPTNHQTIMGVFYDFMQDGILDIIFVHYIPTTYNMVAYKNSLDYDANFIKVMVITGLINNEIEQEPTFLGTKRHTFGSNLPGPKISYKTTTQDGIPRAGISDQLPQSAHFAMYLPYTIFGLGRTPNFVEDLTVGMFNESRTWNQIIPNSQLVVIPYPTDNPNKWRAQLFVTPSKIILQSVVALLGTCLAILVIIGLLHLKEKREDRIEKMQELHRFHFDAM